MARSDEADRYARKTFRIDVYRRCFPHRRRTPSQRLWSSRGPWSHPLFFNPRLSFRGSRNGD